MTASVAWTRMAAVGTQLAVWAAASMLIGVVLMTRPSPTVSAVGLQFVVWGAIDAMIAGFGFLDQRRKRARGFDRDAARTEAERRRTFRLLVVNAGLDVVYVAVGLALVLIADPSPIRVGHGVGVLIQGGFLLGFDILHAARLRAPVVAAP